MLLTLLILILLSSWVLLLLDLSINSLSAWALTSDFYIFYQQPRVNTTYDNWLGNVDVYDWHKASSRPYALRFEELYSFFITLIGLLSISITLFWWAYLALNVLWGGLNSLTYGVIGVGLRLLDHLLLSLSWAYFSLGLICLKILLKIPGEFFFW